MVTEIDEMLLNLTVEEINLKRQRALMRRLARRRLGLPPLPVSLRF